MALAASTASQPSSIASAADAVPMPASRITGTVACRDQLEVRGEDRPGVRPCHGESRETALTEVHLADGGQHARRHAGGAGSWGRALEQVDGQTALCCAPGAGQADDAAPDDDQVGPLDHALHLPTPA